ARPLDGMALRRGRTRPERRGHPPRRPARFHTHGRRDRVIERRRNGGDLSLPGIHGQVRFLLALVAAAMLCPGGAAAKGEGVGVWMEGRVSEVRAEGSSIRLALDGRLWLQQYRGAEPSEVEVRDTAIPATLAQGD